MIRDLELPDWFRRTRPGREALQEAEEDRLQRRRVLADRIAELEVEKDRQLPPLREAREEARARVEEARDVLAQAKRARDDADRAFSSRQRQYERRIRAAAAELRRTSSPAIEDFRDECWRLFEEARRHQTSEVQTWEHRGGEWHRGRVVSNYEAVCDRLEAIRKASAAAERLKLAPLSDEELAERLDAIRDGIPEVPEPRELLTAEERKNTEAYLGRHSRRNGAG